MVRGICPCLLVLGVCGLGCSSDGSLSSLNNPAGGAEDTTRVDLASIDWMKIMDLDSNRVIRRGPFTLAPDSKVGGTACDLNGLPLAGAKIMVTPSYDPSSVTSDEQGRFELSWQPQSFRGVDTEFLLVAQHALSNLAVAQAIDPNTTTMDLHLEPGLKISGQVVDPEGAALSHASVALRLYKTRQGFSLSNRPYACDGQGRFVIATIPAGFRYDIEAMAEGFGSVWERLLVNDLDTGIKDMGPVSLTAADLTLSGRVVNVNGSPLMGVEIRASGEGQPISLHTTSDVYGAFAFEKVCAGPIRVYASVSSRVGYLTANVQTEGGVTDLQIVMRKPDARPTYVASREPRSLVGKPSPDLTTLDVKEDIPGDKPMLLCFFDMEQRPSRRAIVQLAKQWKTLEAKGIAVLGIQAVPVDMQTLKNWQEGYAKGIPMGMIDNNVDETKLAWGIKALPWLVLTDKEHVVKAEGFEVSELEKILLKEM